MRLMGPDDAQSLESYPYLISRKAKTRVACQVLRLLSVSLQGK